MRRKLKRKWKSNMDKKGFRNRIGRRKILREIKKNNSEIDDR